MEIEKPSKRDMDAAMELVGIIDGLSNQFYPCLLDILGCDDIHEFDPDDPIHLRALYDKLEGLWCRAPGFAGRVILGMCLAIMYDKNEIVAPDSDALKLHPKIIAALAKAEKAKNG